MKNRHDSDKKQHEKGVVANCKTSLKATLIAVVGNLTWFLTTLIPGKRRGNLEILWANLHLGLFHRVVVIFPEFPHHSLIVELAVQVQTIQVGLVTTVVPPAAFRPQGTVTGALVIIAIPGGKWQTTVIT